MLPLTISAKESESNMNQKEIVIKYDYSPEESLKASTPDLHRVTKNILYLKGQITLRLLEEDSDISISGITESKLIFYKNKFQSASFHVTSLGHWYTLEDSIKKILEIRRDLSKILRIVEHENIFDLSNLSNKKFDNKNNIVIDSYDLNNYRIFLVLKKFYFPKEAFPRSQDHFQLELIIDAK
jgi:hypothetical protein